VSAFPTFGLVLGACGIAGGALYLIYTALRSPIATTGEIGPAVLLMIGSCVAGLGVVLIAGVAGAAGGDGR